MEKLQGHVLKVSPFPWLAMYLAIAIGSYKASPFGPVSRTELASPKGAEDDNKAVLVLSRAECFKVTPQADAVTRPGSAAVSPGEKCSVKSGAMVLLEALTTTAQT